MDKNSVAERTKSLQWSQRRQRQKKATICGFAALILTPKPIQKLTYDTALPTIFRPNDECTPRSVRYETARKRRQLEFSDCKTNTLLPSQVLLADADGEITTDLVDVRSSNADFRDAQHDHSYCFSEEDDPSSTVLLQDTEPEMVRSQRSVGCQTDMTLFNLEKLDNEVKNLKNRLNDKAKLKPDLFMEDVLENDDSVKF